MSSSILALDVDGTLFDGRVVDPAAVAAIESTVADGTAVVIVSGRPWRDLQRIIPEVLRATTVAVCEHGAALVDVASGEIRPLVEPVAPAVASLIAEADGNEMVVYEATIGLPASARPLAEDVCARVGGCYVVGNKDSIAIVPIGCDKGTGLRHAVDHLARSDPAMSTRRIIAIGDATNDLPMFAIADVAVAVANAEPVLADMGVEMTHDAFGAGVAEAISRYLLADAQRTRTTPSVSPPRTS